MASSVLYIKDNSKLNNKHLGDSLCWFCIEVLLLNNMKC